MAARLYRYQIQLMLCCGFGTSGKKNLAVSHYTADLLLHHSALYSFEGL